MNTLKFHSAAVASNPTYAALEKDNNIEEIVITGIAGTDVPLSPIPGAAQFISQQEIDEQMDIS